ncbi:MAG TPA: hypothetical protein VFZ17_14385 [Acidimicrobiia bacterium]|nr:hypothetical protein [Acidimicrobiia bacterium]
MSNWLDQRAASGTQAEAVLADLAAGKVSAKAAKKQLAQAYTKGAATSAALLKSVKSAGTPAITDGKAMASQYVATLSGYANAYKTAATTFAQDKATSSAEIAAAAQQVNAKLASDLAVVGTDPIEDLRPVTELATSLTAACGAVETYLVKSIDAPCRGAVDSVQTVLDAEARFEAAALDSPEEAAANTEWFEASHNLRSTLGGCNVPGVASGGCRTVLQSALGYVDAANRFESSPIDSPEEDVANTDMSTVLAQLATQIAKCPK